MKQFVSFKEKKFSYAYFGLMLLFYFGYVLLDNYRYILSPSLSKSFLTPDDIQNFSQLGKWTSNFELMFLVLFIIPAIYFCYRKNVKALKRFILANMILFIVIAGIGYVLFLTTPSPIGNLMEPLFLPTYVVAGLLIYMLWLMKKVRGNKH